MNILVEKYENQLKNDGYNSKEVFDVLNNPLCYDFYMRKNGYTLYPSKENLFKAFDLCHYDDVKVVIVGQDPYHEKGQANGLAFSVDKDIATPPSLRNIFTELKDDIGISRSDTDLSDWAKQGVLLLNTALSVKEHQANSLKEAWMPFTVEIMKLLNKHEKSLIFVLWGKNAQDLKKYITDSKHIIIESAHPSPLSAYRGFFGSKPFSRINKHCNIKWG